MALIHTKLNRPLVADNFIARPHLKELLGRSLRKPLTLVTAPAGYGKSSLISNQIANYDLANSWLSLDENDNDLALFLSYFIAAVQRIFPDALQETSTLVSTPSLPSTSMLSTSLVNELARIEQPFILVLDDYHLVTEQSVHDLLGKILRYPSASMHMVIISRHDPPLPTATYRAKGQLSEIGPQDTVFSLQETVVYLSQAFGREVDTATATMWHERTEGWVTGLQLGVFAIRHQVEFSDLPFASLKVAPYTNEYLYDQIFAAQTLEIQHFLLSTSILDRFNGPLCEAVGRLGDKPVAEGMTGLEFISWLKKENLFVIPLDEESGWYRYHHLFKTLLSLLLKKHRDQKDIHRLHTQASHWFAEQGFTEEALLHALAAGDTKRAVGLIVQSGVQLMDNQDWPSLERWLRLLPREEVEQNPNILVYEAWLFHIKHNVEDLISCLRKIEALRAASNPHDHSSSFSLESHYEALMGFESYMNSDGQQALFYTQRACEKIPPHHKRGQTFAQIFRLGAYQMLGDLETGLSIYRNAMKDWTLVKEEYHHMFMVNLCFVYWIDADLVSLRRTAECSLLVDHSERLPETEAMGHYFMGVFYYEQNDLGRAEEHLLKVLEGFYPSHALLFACSSFVLSLIYQAKGKPGKARRSSEQVINYANETNNGVVMYFAQAFSAELALRQGRLAEASHWAMSANVENLEPTYLFYMPQLTLVKVLLAQDTVASRQKAAMQLDRLQAYQTSIHNKVFLIDVLILQALLKATESDYNTALEKLEQAIEIAEPVGMLSPLLGHGPPMKNLLIELQRQGRHLHFVELLLKESKRIFSSSNGLNPDTAKVNLSNRELDILELASKRFRDKEIAESLSISSATVKTHMRNIRKKTGRQFPRCGR